MWKCILFALFIIFVVIVPHSITSAQDNILYIELTVESADSQYPEDFIERFKNALSELHIKPIFIKEYNEAYPNFWEKQAVHLSFDYTSEGIDFLVTPYLDMFLLNSPILEAAYDHVTRVKIRADEENSLDSAVKVAVGISLYATYRCNEAAQHLQNTLADPLFSTGYSDTNLSLEFYIATCQLLNGDYHSSIPIFEKLLPKDVTLLTSYPATLTNLAWAYFQQNRKQEAFDLIERELTALRAETTGPYPFFTLLDITRLLSRRAQLYALEGQYDQAVSDVNEAITTMEAHQDLFDTTRTARLYTLRGEMYLYLYEWDKVLDDYNKALELDPEYADAYFLRGVLYYSILQTGTENYPLALSDFRRYIELAPDGIHAAEATKYADQIQTQQHTLNS